MPTRTPPTTAETPTGCRSERELRQTEQKFTLKSLEELENDMGCSVQDLYPFMHHFLATNTVGIVRHVARTRHPGLVASMLFCIGSLTIAPTSVSTSLYELTLLYLPKEGPLCHDQFITYIHVGACLNSVILIKKATLLAREFEQTSTPSMDPVDMKERNEALLIMWNWPEVIKYLPVIVDILAMS